MRFKRFPYKSPVDVFLKICEKCECAFLLESIDGDYSGKSARFSFIGYDPIAMFKAKDGVLEIGGFRLRVEDPLIALRDILSVGSSSRDFRYVGGAVGYISYDAVRYWEKIPNISIDDLVFPDIEMGIYGDGLIFDHKTQEAFYFYRSVDRYSDLLMLTKGSPSIQSLSFSTPKVNIEMSRYYEVIERAKEYIYSGDILQVVLSKRFTSRFKGGFEGFYLNLRRINPSPYMYFLKMGDRFIIGSSPETLIRVEDGVIETCPIAGTRPITGDLEKDAMLEFEMINDPKEISEHVMLLDLARNDVGRVAEYGSVRVTEFMKVYKYSHVQHIVSKVIGKLREDCNCFDVLRSAFPAGTVSGAPKVRAMEIIEEMEGFRRGPYAGAVGYFSFNGNMDFAITIRTLFAKDGRLHIQVGSGIVADSTPEGEWMETEFKAKALMKALEEAAEVG